MAIWTDAKARFHEVALPHIETVYRFARHLSASEADAEDLTQDCFHQAFRKFHQFQSGTNCRAWLFRITRNAHIDRLRRRGRDPVSTGLPELDADRVADTTPQNAPARPEDRVEKWRELGLGDDRVFCELFGDEVNTFLGELQPEFRLAVVLCDVEGFSYEEIAGILDCPIGTVRSRIARARTHLKEKLFTYAQELGFVRSERD